MIIEDEEVKTYRRRAFCECGGEWKYKGHKIISEYKLDHVCNGCGKEENLNYVYPRIVYGFDMEDVVGVFYD